MNPSRSKTDYGTYGLSRTLVSRFYFSRNVYVSDLGGYDFFGKGTLYSSLPQLRPAFICKSVYLLGAETLSEDVLGNLTLLKMNMEPLTVVPAVLLKNASQMALPVPEIISELVEFKWTLPAKNCGHAGNKVLTLFMVGVAVVHS